MMPTEQSFQESRSVSQELFSLEDKQPETELLKDGREFLNNVVAKREADNERAAKTVSK